ncbi:hypothetical protein L593_07245 [Salinarchaeum sp. Harcht-Bsk1]|uniref:hypothetical protein n=1 Tax=Salinarchaeum sp. Harcht-Bsk1 TaxID=1333523 RepID=UPI0003423D95|nr:hypothetical protein [Salinarchaeum sp. Harcht-Bsk1]AGN01396.1 hypothetical protein L593_07245 [Salinarchaeum sp. Harcht-Bsk1]
MSEAGDHSDAETGTDAPTDEDPLADVPDWDDEYVDEVAGRLVHNYDLEQDRTVEGESFDLYGAMEIHSQKHIIHPSISFAHHESHEHLFLRRVEHATVAEIDRLVALGHDLADEWVEADEEHYSTDFTFVLVAPEVPDDVDERVAAVDERTLLKYGYNGHYDVHVAVVAPEQERLVVSEDADVAEALALWEPIEREEPGLLGLISRRLQI